MRLLLNARSRQQIMTLQLATNITAMTRAKNRKEMLKNKETKDVSNQPYQNGIKNDQEESRNM